MELDAAFFFDSYALWEIIAGNKSYEPYQKVIMVTTKLNLMELHYGLLREFGKEKADKYYDQLIEYTVEIEDNVIKKANEFKASLKERNLSYVDCIGYTMAKIRGMKFLTGDKQFIDLEGVEFVK